MMPYALKRFASETTVIVVPGQDVALIWRVVGPLPPLTINATKSLSRLGLRVDYSRLKSFPLFSGSLNGMQCLLLRPRLTSTTSRDICMHLISFTGAKIANPALTGLLPALQNAATPNNITGINDYV